MTISGGVFLHSNKIAIVTDSGTDVPPEFSEEHGVFTAPLSIHCGSETYLDRVNISVEEVYDKLTDTIMTTSLPAGHVILATLQRVLDAGYKQVLVITVAGSLSGTHGAMRLIAQQVPALEYRFIDTKSVGIGAGMTVMRALEFIKAGLNLDEIETRLRDTIANTRLFFSLGTLKYLARSGRIGKITATVGSLLTVRPVMSINSEGFIYTVQRVRGRIQSIRATIRHAGNFVRDGRFNLALAHGAARKELETMRGMMGDLVERATNVFEGNVGPALGVHSGPGLLGIGVQRLDRRD